MSISTALLPFPKMFNQGYYFMFQFFVCLFVVFVALVGVGIWAIVAKGSVSNDCIHS